MSLTDDELSSLVCSSCEMLDSSELCSPCEALALLVLFCEFCELCEEVELVRSLDDCSVLIDEELSPSPLPFLQPANDAIDTANNAQSIKVIHFFITFSYFLKGSCKSSQPL